MAEGEAGLNWFLLFSAVGWAEYIFGGLMLKIKGMDNQSYKWILGLGYLTFFAFIACTNVAIKHLVESDGALTGSITNNLERVVQTVEKVKVASNEIVDSVTVVRELADENRIGAEEVVTDMHILWDAECRRIVKPLKKIFLV